MLKVFTTLQEKKINIMTKWSAFLFFSISRMLLKPKIITVDFITIPFKELYPFDRPLDQPKT